MAGVFTVLGLGILLKLGFWQIDRLAWKEDLLARVEANMAAPAIPLEEEIPAAPLPETMDFSTWEYRRICAGGEFWHEKELYVLGSSIDGRGGVLVYTPLQLERGQILVNRGWVPNDLKNSEARPAGQVGGLVEVCGVIRLDRKKGLFTPENNATDNRWFTPKVLPMARAAGLDNPHPFFLEADDTENPGGYPLGGQTFVNIPNNHLGYAITWFGLAVALLGVFGVFAWRRVKNRQS